MSFIAQAKGLSKDALVYGIGGAVSRFIGLFTAPVLTRIFVPADYGTISLMQTVVSFLIMLAGFNLNSGVFRYYFEYDDPREKRAILSTSFLSYLVVGLCLSAITWIGAPLVSDMIEIRQTGIGEEGLYNYTKYIQIMAVGVVFSILYTNFQALLRLTRQPSKYMALNILQVLSNFALTILVVVYWKLGIEGALWASVIANIVVCIVGFLMVAKFYAPAFSLSFLTLFLSYSLPQFPSVIISWMMTQSNRFFLNYYAPLAEQGYYSIALKVASVFALATVAFRLAWDPFAMSILKHREAASTYSRIYTLYLVGLGWFAACVSLFAKPILVILTPPSYHAAYPIIFVLIFTYLYQGSNNILGVGIAISKRTKYISYAQTIVFIVNIILNFLLVPRLYAWGAAVALIGGMFAQSLAFYYYSQRLHPIPYRFWRLHSFVLLLALIIALQNYIVRDLGLLYSILVALPFALVLSFLSWKLGLRTEERRRVIDSLSPALLRLKSLHSSTDSSRP